MTRKERAVQTTEAGRSVNYSHYEVARNETDGQTAIFLSHPLADKVVDGSLDLQRRELVLMFESGDVLRLSGMSDELLSDVVSESHIIVAWLTPTGQFDVILIGDLQYEKRD